MPTSDDHSQLPPSVYGGEDEPFAPHSESPKRGRPFKDPALRGPSKAALLFAQRLRQARIEGGMNQREFADALGVSDKAISSYEVGRTEPNLEFMQKVSRLTFKPIAYFVDPSDQDDVILQAKLAKIEQELMEIKKLLQRPKDLFREEEKLTQSEEGDLSLK
jgi:transcriptional regulator with XRE-family HTH domain